MATRIMRFVNMLGLLGVLVVGCGRAAAAYEAPRVKPTDVQVHMAKGEKVRIVDVRSPDAFAREHIVGAVNVPASKLSETPGGLPKDMLILLYCT